MFLLRGDSQIVLTTSVAEIFRLFNLHTGFNPLFPATDFLLFLFSVGLFPTEFYFQVKVFLPDYCVVSLV